MYYYVFFFSTECYAGATAARINKLIEPMLRRQIVNFLGASKA